MAQKLVVSFVKKKEKKDCVVFNIQASIVRLMLSSTGIITCESVNVDFNWQIFVKVTHYLVVPFVKA